MSDKAKGMIQLIAVIIFIAGSFMVSALLQSTKAPVRERAENDRALYVDTKTVTPSPYRIKFETTGTVEARATIDIVPQVNGRIVEINDSLFEGGTFKAGEILFRIDPRDYELEVERLDAEVARAKTALDLTKAESDAALSEWKILHKNKDAPDLVARKPQMAEAQTNLKAAKAQLENARLDLERTAYTLPFDGRVLEGTLELGQYVANGQNYGSVFDINGLEVRASLEDRKLDWLMSTDDTDVVIKARYLGKDAEYKGVLKRKAASLDNATRFATVAFGFNDEAIDILPGVFATIEIRGPAHNNIVTIPSSAMQKEGIIWIVKPDNTLISMKPDILFSDNDHITVQNITDTTKVVTSRVSGASDGVKIMVEDDEDTTQNNNDQKSE